MIANVQIKIHAVLFPDGGGSGEGVNLPLFRKFEKKVFFLTTIISFCNKFSNRNYYSAQKS